MRGPRERRKYIEKSLTNRFSKCRCASLFDGHEGPRWNVWQRYHESRWDWGRGRHRRRLSRLGRPTTDCGVSRLAWGQLLGFLPWYGVIFVYLNNWSSRSCSNRNWQLEIGDWRLGIEFPQKPMGRSRTTPNCQSPISCVLNPTSF